MAAPTNCPPAGTLGRDELQNATSDEPRPKPLVLNNGQELIIKPAGSTPLQVFWRVVRRDEEGEYVLHRGMKAYIIRKGGDNFIDYWMDKSKKQAS